MVCLNAIDARLRVRLKEADEISDVFLVIKLFLIGCLYPETTVFHRIIFGGVTVFFA